MRLRRVAPLLWLTLVAACALAARTPRQLLPMQARRIFVDEEVVARIGSVSLRDGDYVVMRAGERLVLGGLARPAGERGAVLVYDDGQGHTDALHFAPELVVDGVARPLRVLRMNVMPHTDGSVVRVEGDVDYAGVSLVVAAEIGFGRTPGVLSMATRITASAGLSDVRFGAELGLTASSLFVPGQGDLTDEQHRHGPCVVGHLDTRGLALGFAQGAASARIDTPQEGRPPDIHLAEAEPSALSARVPRTGKVLLVVAEGGSGPAARRFGHARGRPYAELWTWLPRRPPFARATLYTASHQVLVNTAPDDLGRAVLPLVEERNDIPFTARATAPGFAESDPLLVTRTSHRTGVLRIPEGRQLRLRVHDDQGAPLPARARILGIDGTAPVELGPAHVAQGAGDVVVMLHGRADVQVPPGRYHVVTTHGPAYTAHTAEVEVTDTHGPLVEASLVQEVVLQGEVASDLHVHSENSPDSRITLADRLATLAAEDVALAIPTDHNHITDYAPTARALGLTHIHTLPGVEITTERPGFGHFNAYPLERDAAREGAGAPPFAEQTPGSLFAQVHALEPSVVVQVNHPRLPGGIGYFDLLRLKADTGSAAAGYSEDFDAIEVWNGYELGARDAVERNLRDFLDILARGKRVAATGSSDSHQVLHHAPGYPRTMVHVGDEAAGDPYAVVAAIKRGASYVTSGPFLQLTVNGEGPGHEVHASDGSFSVSLEVRAASWVPTARVALYIGKERAYTFAIPRPVNAAQPDAPPATLRFALHDLPIRVASDTVVTARVEADTSVAHHLGQADALAFAFTNPVFLDADGDGRTPWSQP
jgi:hypothetical protein